MPENPPVFSEEVVRLAPGASHKFGSTEQVSWTCTGGHIEQNGLYTAGSTEGTFVVMASQAGAPTKTTEKIVVIGDGPIVPPKPTDPPTITPPFAKVALGGSQKFTSNVP